MDNLFKPFAKGYISDCHAGMNAQFGGVLGVYKGDREQNNTGWRSRTYEPAMCAKTIQQQVSPGHVFSCAVA